MASAYEIPGFSFTIEAANDLAGKYRFVSVDASGLGVNASAGEGATGVRQNEVKAGQAITCTVNGVSIVESDEAIAAGDAVAAGPAGKAVKAVAGDVVLGSALTGADAAGVLVSVLLSTPVAAAPVA